MKTKHLTQRFGIVAMLVLTFFLSNCAPQKQLAPVVQVTQPEAPMLPIAEKTLPRELKWVLQSAEYEAICNIVYQKAWESVKQQASLTNENWAVVLDIDETVLTNASYEDTLIRHGKSYPYFWADWVNQGTCPPVPGVKAFLDSVRTLDRAHVAFITNRKAVFEASTIANLKKENLWGDGDVLLCQIDKKDTKEIRRQEVINGSGRCDGNGTRKILALIGDQLGDMDDYEAVSATSSAALVEHYRNHPNWGVTFFMLPNPVYGDWLGGYGKK